VAKDSTATQPPDPGAGAPPRDTQRASDILHVEVAKIQSDLEYLKRDLSESRTDMKEMRDRMARLETEVKHLPSKEFIVTVVVVALGLAGGLLTIAPKLQSWAGTAPATVTVVPAHQ
jgi:hypothetical protein